MSKSPKKKTTRPKPPPQAERHRRIRLDHAGETGEDYVELIDDLQTAEGEARLVDLAQHMNVSHVTANRTIARLQRDGLVQTKPYRAIFLTPKGKKLATKSRDRHRLVYELLRAIGVPSPQAQIDAEGIEHHVSGTTRKAITKFLKNRID